MPAAVKRASHPATTVSTAILRHALWFVAAGLFVSVLSLTYGLDLSAGLF